MKPSDWVKKLYGFDRMIEYRKALQNFPSLEYKRTFGDPLSGLSGKRPNWTPGFGYGYTPPSVDKIKIGSVEVDYYSDAILVVPEGKLKLVPERIKNMTIELPNSHGYAIIR